MRLKALQELKYKEIPDEWVKRADELTEEEKKRFIIADNVGFGEWDMDILANEWDENDLSEWGVDLPEFNTKTEKIQADVIFTRVHFRELSDKTIHEYIRRDNPLHCAGSIKAEGLGMALFTKMETEDPTAILGFQRLLPQRPLPPSCK